MQARVPGSDRWNYAVGGSCQLTPGFMTDAGANYIDLKDATIDQLTAAYQGTAAQTPILTSGELRNAHAFVLSLGGRLKL